MQAEKWRIEGGLCCRRNIYDHVKLHKCLLNLLLINNKYNIYFSCSYLNISSFQLGFFKRLTKEEMTKNLNEKLEIARMKEDLDVCVAEKEDDLSSS